MEVPSLSGRFPGSYSMVQRLGEGSVDVLQPLEVAIFLCLRITAARTIHRSSSIWISLPYTVWRQIFEKHNFHVLRGWAPKRESCAGVQITSQSKRYLGAALGTASFVEAYVGLQVEKWVLEIERLASIASSQPHAVYTAFMHGLAASWNYVSCTIPDIGDLVDSVEKATNCSPHLLAYQG